MRAVVVILAMCGTTCGSILEVLVGPRLGRRLGDEGMMKSGEDVRNVSEAQYLIESFGYPYEEHDVTTPDGYKLKMHRIPHGRKHRAKEKKARQVVLLQHGYLGASDNFLFRGPDKDLSYMLADSGCDVWLSNVRGNLYARNHESLDPDKDEEFWRFSLHEVAYYDLPSQIDYVLNISNHSAVHFVGYSIGATIAIMMGTLKPEYNLKIKQHFALAPFLFFMHETTTEQNILLSAVPVLFDWAQSDKILCMLPRRPQLSRILEFSCSQGVPTRQLCLNLIYSFAGKNSQQIDSINFPQMLRYFPAGTGLYFGMHGFQLLQKGKFSFRFASSGSLSVKMEAEKFSRCGNLRHTGLIARTIISGSLVPFDYGDEAINVRMYNSTLLPVYNLTLVTHPVRLVYGKLDIVVSEKDIGYVKKALPNVVETYQVPFNHMDFIWGKDTKAVLNERIIMLIKKSS